MLDKLGWVCIENGKILLARSYGKTAWYIPGGKREPGESDAAALLREIREELAVELDPESLSECGQFRSQADGKPAGTEVLLTCYEARYQGVITPSAEIEAVMWCAYDDRDLTSLVTQCVMELLYEQKRLM